MEMILVGLQISVSGYLLFTWFVPRYYTKNLTHGIRVRIDNHHRTQSKKSFYLNA